MKMLVVAVAFATLVASPALAQWYGAPALGQSYGTDFRSGNTVPQLRGPLYQDNHRAYRGQIYHWPRYDAQGVDQNAPGE
jgi:hypothetical protein